MTKQLSLFDTPIFTEAEIKDFSVQGLRSAFKQVSIMTVNEIKNLTKNEKAPALLSVVAKNIQKAYNTGDLKTCDTLFKVIGLYEADQIQETNQVAKIEIVGTSSFKFDDKTKRLEVDADNE